MADILDEIVERRREDYARLGPCFGVDVPLQRARPIVPFLKETGVILEIKRASPSKGDIAPDLDPVSLARSYESSGARCVSVLTEQRFFKGSLNDLIAVSSACSSLSFLRKDFLLYEDEIDVAYRSGADAVLLIARILDAPLLLKMAARCRSFGMLPFIEVREAGDLAKLEAASKAGTVLAGVNSRDLATFHIDPLIPAALRNRLPCRTVFESGASTPLACRFARRLGFDGILIGEAAAKNPEKAASLVRGFVDARPDWVGHFWREVGRRSAACGEEKRPLVKICGLTNEEDALLAADLGADLLGFVFAPSPRSADPRKVRDIAARLTARSRLPASECVGALSSPVSRPRKTPLRPFLIGVVTDLDSDQGRDALALALDGVLDGIQFHGDDPRAGLDRIEEAGGSYGIGRYAVVRLGSEDDLELIQDLRRDGEPRVLLDARVEGLAGGTGTSIPRRLVRLAADAGTLWLAGGLHPGNVRSCIDEFSPALIDASSGLESVPGKKDHALMKSYFREIFR